MEATKEILMSNASAALLQDFSDALSQRVAGAAPGLVAVHSPRACASGFVWRPGLIVTAENALAEDGEIIVVAPGGASASATLVGRDPTTDVALLRLANAEAPAAALAAEPAAVGALAIVVGARDGAPVAALGVVAVSDGPWRSLRGGAIDARIELDATLRRSSEGALALDASGRAFGMVVFGPRRRTLVIPAATIERVAAALLEKGRIARGYLGLGLQPVRIEHGRIGAMAMSVDAGGPGAAAGVRQGDVIVAWDGAPLRGIGALVRALGPDSVGRTVKLSLSRGGEPEEASLTIGERPEA
jgi:S1-C subfamily serine protease